MSPVLRTALTHAGLVAVSLGWAGACSSPPRGFASPDPGARLDAIVDAAADEDPGAVRPLIVLLESDDPAVRLAAIRTLERITGETFGYDFAAPAWKRREQVDRWEAWYRDTRGVEPGAPGALPPDRINGP